MGAPTVPPVIPIPWATNNPTLRNAIPDTTATPGLASWDQGWPAPTMQPVVAGGVPPEGQDFNGVDFTLSSHDYYVQAGCTFPFQAAVATAIGGYGVGAILGSATDRDVVWFNTVTNNTTNPDATDGSAVGWVSLFAYGFATPSAMTGAAPVVLTNLQASRKFLVFTGALGANQTVSLPANILKDWLVVNNTTGSSFTLTLNTTAGGSVGVAVPQGGWSNPLGVYSDGTNVYPTVAPLGIPISQAATPLTLAERTNLGYILATYFNQSSPSNENPAVGSVFVESGGDGYLRKASLAYLESVMALSAIGGQVSAGQVPLAAVIQYVTNILASAALTGVPTTPTAALGATGTQVASLSFANPGSILAMPGAFRLPSGHLVTYGACNPNGGTITVTLPAAYASASSYAVGSFSSSHPTQSNASAIDAQHISVTNTGGPGFFFTVGF